jgi:uroporphyrin-III C-methyltransferase
MGMHKLSQITAVFQKLNKGDTPAAVIQNGTMDNERSGIGNINSIESIVQENNLSSPAIIIIGDVVLESTSIKELNKKLELHLAS